MCLNLRRKKGQAAGGESEERGRISEEDKNRARVNNRGRIGRGDGSGGLLRDRSNHRGFNRGSWLEKGHQREELRAEERLESRKGAKGDKMENVSDEKGIQHRLVGQGGKEKRNMAKRGKRRRGERRRSGDPKRRRKGRRERKVGGERRLLPRNRLKSLQSIVNRAGDDKHAELIEEGGDDNGDVDGDEDEDEEGEERERRLRRRTLS